MPASTCRLCLFLLGDILQFTVISQPPLCWALCILAGMSNKSYRCQIQNLSHMSYLIDVFTGVKKQYFLIQRGNACQKHFWPPTSCSMVCCQDFLQGCKWIIWLMVQICMNELKQQFGPNKNKRDDCFCSWNQLDIKLECHARDKSLNVLLGPQTRITGRGGKNTKRPGSWKQRAT